MMNDDTIHVSELNSLLSLLLVAYYLAAIDQSFYSKVWRHRLFSAF